MIAVFTKEQLGLFGPILQDAKWLPSLKLLGEKNTKVSPHIQLFQSGKHQWQSSVTLFHLLHSAPGSMLQYHWHEQEWHRAIEWLWRSTVPAWCCSALQPLPYSTAAPQGTWLQLPNLSGIHHGEESPTWELRHLPPLILHGREASKASAAVPINRSCKSLHMLLIRDPSSVWNFLSDYEGAEWSWQSKTANEKANSSREQVRMRKFTIPKCMDLLVSLLLWYNLKPKKGSGDHWTTHHGIRKVMMNAYRGSVIESSPQRTVWDKMGSRFVKNMNSEQNHLSKNFSFDVDNLFSCTHLETYDKCPFFHDFCLLFFFIRPQC